VVVCPPVAEAEFKDRTGHVAHEIDSAIEATALCLEPANEAVQTVLSGLAPRPLANEGWPGYEPPLTEG
jgi:hypothetical protein